MFIDKTKFQSKACSPGLDSQGIPEDDASGLQASPAGILQSRQQTPAECDVSAIGTGSPMQTEQDQTDVRAEKRPDHQKLSSLVSIKSCLVTPRPRLPHFILIYIVTHSRSGSLESVYDYFTYWLWLQPLPMSEIHIPDSSGIFNDICVNFVVILWYI